MTVQTIVLEFDSFGESRAAHQALANADGVFQTRNSHGDESIMFDSGLTIKCRAKTGKRDLLAPKPCSCQHV